MDCSPPGPSVHGISQARILEWVAISFFQGIFPTQGSNPSLLHCRQILYFLSHHGSLLHCECSSNKIEQIKFAQLQGTVTISVQIGDASKDMRQVEEKF